MNWIKDKIKSYWKWITILVLGGVAMAQIVGFPPPSLTNLELAEQCIAIPKKIDECILNLNTGEKAQIKSQEIEKRNHVGEFTESKYGYKIDIQSLKAKDIRGQYAIEVFARAWKGTKQLGFGKDGTVEIERFIFVNPPVLVSDPQGTIIRNYTDHKGNPRTLILREDLIEAVRRDLAWAVSHSGVESNKIVKGKVGSTTTTCRPDPDIETTTVDGQNANFGNPYATIHDAASAGGNSTQTAGVPFQNAKVDANNWQINRGTFLCDLSSVPTGDTIDSGTFSLFSNGDAVDTETTCPADIRLISHTVATNTNLVGGDFAASSFGTTLYASVYDMGTYDALADQGEASFTLNADGRTFVTDKIDTASGIVNFGARGQGDVDNCASTADSYGAAYFADQAGTNLDPKLVIVHSAAAAAGKARRIIID